MKLVYKYPLYPSTPTVVSMPRGAEILYVGQQNGAPALWALVSEGALLESREFFVFGTGHPFVEDGLRYVGTVQIPTTDWPGGELVWHVFER